MMDLVGPSCCRLSVSLNWWILGFTLWGLAIFVVLQISKAKFCRF